MHLLQGACQQLSPGERRWWRTEVRAMSRQLESGVLEVASAGRLPPCDGVSTSKSTPLFMVGEQLRATPDGCVELLVVFTML